MKNDPILTIEEAKLVRQWRSSNGKTTTASWRWVATEAANKWPEKKLCAHNQIEGMLLCKEAALLLGEMPYENPWN